MNRRMFGIKDIFTSINLLGGVVAIALCIEGYPFEAGLAVLLGYVCGDAIDGWIARKLNSANEFGAQYDIVADHLSHVIAPAAIVYSVYAGSTLLASELANQILGVVLAALVIGASTIRHARNAVRSIPVKGIWSGLPRTVFGFMVMGFVLSMAVAEMPELLWVGVVLVPLASWATLSRLPFSNHRLPRALPLWSKLLIIATFALLISALFVYPRVFFDLFFLTMFVYSLGSFVILTREELNEYRAAVSAAAEESA